MIKSIFSIAVFFLISFVASAASDSETALKLFLEETSRLEARFEQTLESGMGGAVEKSSGHFYLQKPNRFRWDYLAPYRQEIVSDGNKIWYYDADLEQVTVKSFESLQHSSPLMLLSGRASLLEKFEVTEVASSDGINRVRLTPKKSEESFESVLLGFNDQKLVDMAIHDRFGQTTTIWFYDVQTDKKLADELFSFEVPEGADVLQSD